MVKHCPQCGRPRFNPWVRKIPWRRKWQPTSGFSPGKSHGQRSLPGYSSWGYKESDTTEWLHFYFSLSFHMSNIIWEIIFLRRNIIEKWYFLRNLYARQEATVRTRHGTTDWFQIGKGVHQGCILSPCLFNLCAEYIMQNANELDEAKVGIKIGRRNIDNFRYADDTTLMTESKKEMRSLLMKVQEESENVGLKLNIQTTKLMASSPITSCQIDEETMEAVRDFLFLSFRITADGDCSHEIKRCLLLGRKAMINPDSILKSRDITLPTKVHLVKAMVFPVVMYGCENWTIKKAEHQRIDPFELWCWRRLLRVSWTAMRSN